MVQTGTRAVDTLRDTTAFAQGLEDLGYHRLWYAEHHHSPAIGAFPPVVLTAHAAASTSAIRLGSGGVLAPNHAPLALAEQFGTLAALHEDRIDLGIGRGPGTFDDATARALRRGAGPATDAEYRDDVAAILSFLVDEVALGPLPEPWLLASSPAGPRSPRHSACRSRSPTTSGRTTRLRFWSAIGRPSPRPAGASGPACCCAWRRCARRRRRKPYDVRDR